MLAHGCAQPVSCSWTGGTGLGCVQDSKGILLSRKPSGRSWVKWGQELARPWVGVCLLPWLQAGLCTLGVLLALAPKLLWSCGRRLRIRELEEAEEFEAQQGRTLRLLRAVYQCVAAHSELLCYFIIILNHMVTASAASLVLPMLIFLWAMLTIPRPSKRFWMTAIVFTEVGGSLKGWGGAAWPVLSALSCRSWWSPSTCSSLASSPGIVTWCCGATRTSPTSLPVSWVLRKLTVTSSMTWCSSWPSSSTAPSYW